jgi:hypothetical protein
MSFKQSRMDRHVHIIKNLSKAMYHLTSYGSFDDNDQKALALMLQATSIIATDAHSDLTTESKHPANDIQTAYIKQFEREVHDAYKRQVSKQTKKEENTND